ncbi:DUF4419 domain-containing protein [Kitasatospora sp. NPDC058965]|uniref:DUF4419 domain-containing protein n=1 Tax=Kitasatospora sp. NPDC058965 TaxID=3346682 RepID=UPI003674703B
MEFDLPVVDSPEAVKLAAELTEVGNERFLRAVLRDRVVFHHRSGEGLLGWPTDAPEVTEPTSSLLLRAMHTSFAAHLPLSLAPDLFWYTVVHEVAVHVRLNADTYAELFTQKPGERPIITVQDDNAPLDWEHSINLVRGPLADAIGEAMTRRFLPRFSTTGVTEATAVLVALMDVVTPYYRFCWLTLCGIPRIRLEGTAEDWRMLAVRLRELAEPFPGLADWFAGLHPVLDAIAATAAGAPVDEEFWRSCYKYRSASGGPTVTGWINAFFAHDYLDEGPRPKEEFGPGGSAVATYPSHVSRVPFVWKTPAGVYNMAFLGGVLGIERDGEWLRPRLGNAVVQVLPHLDRDERLPEPWTLADIQRARNVLDVSILDPAPAVSLRGEAMVADCVIEAGGICYVRTPDGDWYLGEFVSPERGVELWFNCGPDLADALRAF